MCLLEGEESLAPGTMRPTGDWGCVDIDGRVYCVGRCDRQIKRSGHRVNLDSIQQVCMGLIWIQFNRFVWG